MRRLVGAVTAAAALAWASAASAACSVGIAGEIKLALSRGLPVIEAVLEGKPAKLILGVGDPLSSLSKAATERLGFTTVSVPLTAYVGAEQISARAAMARSTLAGVNVGSVAYLVHPGEKVLPEGIDGIFATGALRNFDIELDLPNGVLRVLKPQDCGGGSLAYWPGGAAVARLSERSDGIFTEVAVNGRTLSAEVTSLTSLSTLSTQGAHLAGLSAKDPGARQAGSDDGDSLWIAPVQSFVIGDETIRNTEIMVRDVNGARPREVPTGSKLRLGVFEDIGIKLGSDFLASHRVLISHSQRKLYVSYVGGRVFKRSAENAAPPP